MKIVNVKVHGFKVGSKACNTVVVAMDTPIFTYLAGELSCESVFEDDVDAIMFCNWGVYGNY